MCSMLVLISFYLALNASYVLLYENIDNNRRRRRRLIALLEDNTTQRTPAILKSGTGCLLLLDMDDTTFQRHFHLSRTQFDVLNTSLERMLPDSHEHHGGRLHVRMEMKTAMFLWYMANQNSFQEIGDKFNVSQSTAHSVITSILGCISNLAQEFIKWPNLQDKETSAAIFRRISGIENVIGAIDGCNIRIRRPVGPHGNDYMNRKGYFSILLQCICDDKGRFIDVFIGPPGRVHDARMLRESDFFSEWEEKTEHFVLLGDSAYISNAFPFIVTPKHDNGQLTEEDLEQNTNISKARVIIENAFGRMKCRWRRLRDLQNVNLDVLVKIMLAACVLHNAGMTSVCNDHSFGCPHEEEDANE